MMFWILACVGKPEPEQANSAPANPGTPLKKEMAWHAIHASKARDAVVAGNLEQAQAMGKALADRLPVLAAPPQGMDHQARLRTVAQGLATAPDLPTAGAQVGQIVEICAECHRDHGIRGGAAKATPAGPQTTAVASEMVAHGRAVAQMWEAILWSDVPGFSAAASALEHTSLYPTGVALDGQDPTLVALEVRVHDLAKSAAEAATTPDEGALFGEMLATCGQCHSLLGQGPSAQIRRPPR